MRLPQHCRAGDEVGDRLHSVTPRRFQCGVHEHVPDERTVLCNAVIDRPDLGEVLLQRVRQRH
jgi:hypothetical protein